MRNCLIARNTATSMQGGGVFGWAILSGCTIVQNQAGSSADGGGVAGGYSSTATVHNCILWGNQPNQAQLAVIDHSDVQGGWAGVGNIDANPLLVDLGAGDYHLAETSPCVDAGDPAYQPGPGEVDLDGQPRLWDGDGNGTARIDMGVDECGAQKHGDLNCDGMFDLADVDAFVLALMDPVGYVLEYPNCDILHGDCNGDGLVSFDDINDFVALLSDVS